MTQRTIKFRAHYDGHIYDVTEIMWSDQTAYIVDPRNEEDGETIPLDKITLLQFTGLHDKNGKEIYEGDVLQLGDFEVGDGKNIGEVKYFGDDGYPAFDIQGNDMETNALSYLIADGEVEVIGNRWENPELLGKYPDSFTSEEQERTSE